MISDGCALAKPTTPEERCLEINRSLEHTGLYQQPQREIHVEQHSSWRIAPEPFVLESELLERIHRLGPLLLAFYRAAQRLYEHAVQGRQPSWVRAYLEQGKTETVLDYGRMRRFRRDVPRIIRPDLFVTDAGLSLSELDSVPGGFGLLDALMTSYAQLDDRYSLVGGSSGIVNSLAAALQAAAGKDDPTAAIIVSQESEAYRGEMEWVSGRLRADGLAVWTLAPEDVVYERDGLYVERKNGKRRIDVVYRFFELFDLKNIPKIDLILFAARKQQVAITPPLKSFLEEKSLYALFHHPRLADFWQQQLGADAWEELQRVIPESWIVDPRPVPPHAAIPGLAVGGKPLHDWHQLKKATQRERELVLKVSGFSDAAWGSRGVTIGHDVSAEVWSDRIDQALDSFSANPYVLQRYHKPRRVRTSYYDFGESKLQTMNGRCRLCPYYFVTQDDVQLAGILATICPLDKKLIHGMVDAVMVPTAVEQELNDSE